MTAPTERDTIKRLSAALAKAEAERDELLAKMPELMRFRWNDEAMRQADERASALEALLAECETTLDDAMGSRDLDETFDLIRALLAKLKARKE